MAVVAALAMAAGVVWAVVFRGGDQAGGTAPVSAPTAGAGQTGEPGEGAGGAEEDEAPVASEPAGDPAVAAEQAQAVDEILSDSGGARAGLGPALDQVRGCEQAQAGIATIQRITDGREEQVAQVEGLVVDAIADGETLKARLSAALGASLEADRRFLAWARRQAQDCTSAWPQDPDYKRGLAASDRATEAKKEFLAMWNPLAREHSLPERAVHEI
ncbi:hypothetical protein HNP84_002788 [Thermocatellispora tengchongensis]|uniref:Uncharacterized protein n=1 Tax=Thermocatellispora tengchongensis TaxID=1073253 RepID=A0A840P774_9ACTN|nr:hypothetical protein [Thermocatellispora tengchongensis]MBB5133067.1 hypothetical protein [Thermocatellispora tengchongensis]